MIWFTIKPVDTIFFKGSEPMVMGSDHAASLIFPPNPETIIGALRTAVLRKEGIAFEEYNKGNAPSEIIEKIGRSGAPAPFTVIGPLFMKDNVVYLPVPYTWYCRKKASKEDSSHQYGEKQKVVITNILRLSKSNVVVDGTPLVYWVKTGLEDLASAGGRWVRIDEFGKREIALYKTEDFYEKEQRTGIALNENKSVRTHHLYSFTHVRLKPGVELVCAISHDIGIRDIPYIYLGAERRMCRIQCIEQITLPEGSANLYMALSIIEGNDNSNKALIAGGKPIYLGGWDMHKKFHKPMKGYYPAGSVFAEKISDNMIQL